MRQVKGEVNFGFNKQRGSDAYSCATALTAGKCTGRKKTKSECLEFTRVPAAKLERTGGYRVVKKNSKEMYKINVEAK